MTDTPTTSGRHASTAAWMSGSAHEEILPLPATIKEDLRILADLGYEGESDTLVVAFKKPAGGELTDLERQFNKAITGYAP